MVIRTVKELGHLVRGYRSRSHLTQAQLADLVGASRKWIIDLEAGKRTANLSLVLRTMNALGIELDASDRARRSDSDEAYVDQIIERSKRLRR